MKKSAEISQCGKYRWWLQRSCERKVLSSLIGVYPDSLSMLDLALRTGMKVSGGFRNSLSKLRTAGLLVGKNTEEMQANPELFEA